MAKLAPLCSPSFLLSPPCQTSRSKSGPRVLASAEFFPRVGQGTTDGFLHALYGAVLGRELDASGSTSWARLLAQGPSRGAVDLAVLASPEAHGRDVRGWYTQLLGRPTDPSGLDLLTRALDHGTPDADVVASPPVRPNTPAGCRLEAPRPSSKGQRQRENAVR
jgi:hypothetical protein